MRIIVIIDYQDDLSTRDETVLEDATAQACADLLRREADRLSETNPEQS